MGKGKRVLDAADIKKVLAENICMPILSDFPDLDNLVLVGIYTRGVYLARRIQKILQRKTKTKPLIGEIDINLYRDDFVRRFDIPEVRQTNIPGGVQDKKVVLVDDVIFTGRTVRAALDVILDIGRPELIKLAVLVSRPGRQMPICPDYIGWDAGSVEKRVYVELEEVDGVDQVVIR